MRRKTLESIERQIDALRMQAEKVKERERVPALRDIVSLMNAHDISVSEVRNALKGGGGRRGPMGKRKGRKGRKSRKGIKVPAMYRNPKTGETWSGRGRAARWLAAAEKAGHKRAEFLIKK